MNKKSIEILEFNKIREFLSELCCSEKAKRTVFEMSCANNLEDAQSLLDYTIEADLLLNFYNQNPVSGFDDIEFALQRSKKRQNLNFAELLKIARMLKSSRYFATTIQELNSDRLPKFSNFAQNIYYDIELEREIFFKIISEDSINDRASEKLFATRKAIIKANDDIKDKLSRFMSSGEHSRFVQDNYVTLRNGRYVIPLKVEHKNAIDGMIHDMSSSGQTVFLEPAVIVSLNNELRILHIAEANEIERILEELTQKVAQIADVLFGNLDILTQSDIVMAKAKYAKLTDSTPPVLNDFGVCEIIEGRHPLIDKTKVVPVSISVGKDYNILTITGPNTGGKTVSIKLVGLLTVMASFGMFLPCSESSKIAIFRDIYCDIGDEQSISESLSTFSSHIVNLKNILTGNIDNCLLLFDELGGGTDPNEGSSIALGILKYILKTNAKAIITTHYSEVKEFSLITDRVYGCGMAFNPTTFEPTYKLTSGLFSTSNAIEIAKRLGLPSEIIQSAKSYMSGDKLMLENVIRKAQEITFEIEEQKQKLVTLKKEFEQKLAEIEAERKKLQNQKDFLTKNAKVEARRIVADAEDEASRIIDELKLILSSDTIKESDLFYARALKKKLFLSTESELETNDYEATKLDSFEVGQTVYIKKFNANAIITSIDTNKRTLSVLCGSIKANITFDDVYKEKEQKQEKRKITKSIATPSYVPNEIKLLGHNVDEAIQILDKYLDTATLCGHLSVKIIHGKGTGKLRQGIWDYLKTHHSVASYRQGRYGEGEAGVTIVTLSCEK